MSRPSPLRGRMGFGVLSFLCAALIGIAASICVARLYGIGVVGAYALALAPAGTLALVASVREQVALVLRLSGVSQPADARRLVAAMVFFSLGAGLVLGSVVVGIGAAVFAGPAARPHLIAPAAVLVASQVVFGAVSGALDAALSARRDARSLFRVRLWQELFYAALAVGSGLVMPNVWTLVGALVASRAIGVVHRIALAWPLLGRPSVADLRAGVRSVPEVGRVGLRVAPGALADGITASVGTWTLGAVGSLAALGAYSRAWGLGHRFRELPARLCEALLPSLVARRERGDHDGFRHVLATTLRLSAAGMLGVAAVGGGAAMGIMELFGPGFSAASGALVVILLVPALAGQSEAVGHALCATGRPVAVTAVAVSRTAAAAAGCVALVGPIGILGPPVALAGAYTLGLVVLHALIWRDAPRLIPLALAVGLAVSFAGAFAIARLVDTSVPGVAGLAAALAAGTAVYGAGLLATGTVDRGTRRRLADRIARLRPSPRAAAGGVGT
jgi:O-antigen/teichoic acid export membrane protein